MSDIDIEALLSEDIEALSEGGGSSHGTAAGGGVEKVPKKRAEQPRLDAEILATAQRNAIKLHKYLTMPSSQFKQLGDKETAQKWWAVLGVEKPPSIKDNHVKTVKALRKVFSSDCLERSGTLWIRRLLKGKVACLPCVGKNTKDGIVSAIVDKIDRHLKNKKHIKRVREMAAALERGQEQGRIDKGRGGIGVEGPSMEERAMMESAGHDMALAMGMLAGGGDGGAGIPPSSIPSYFKNGLLEILREIDGIPSPPNILEKQLPACVEILENRIKAMLQGHFVGAEPGKEVPARIAVGVDGGNSRVLVLSRKIVVVVASSPLWEDDILLDVKMLEKHESGATHASQIEALRQ